MKLKITATFVLSLLATVVFAQTDGGATQQKFGYTNVDYILALLPEAQTAQTELNEYEAQLTAQIQSKYATLQQKVQEYERTAATMIDAVREDKENEINQLQASLQQFQATAEQRMQNRQMQLLEPIYNKIQNVINEYALENGYTYIFRSGALLFAPEGDEISDDILKRLGVDPAAAAAELELNAAQPATGGGN